MLYEHKQDDDDEMKKQAIDDPNVNEFDCWCLRKLRSYGIVEGVHNQHSSNRNWDACLEMFFTEEQGGLKEKLLFSLVQASSPKSKVWTKAEL